MEISKAFEEPKAPTASAGLKDKAAKESIDGIAEFLAKSKRESIHYELWQDSTGLLHLTLTAQSHPDGHILRYDRVCDPLDYENLPRAEHYLVNVLANLEADFKFTATPGKWY